MDKLADPEAIRAFVEGAVNWLLVHVFTLTNLAQLGAIVATFLVARYLSGRAGRWVARLIALRPWSRRVIGIMEPCYLPVIWLAILLLAMAAFAGADLPGYTLRIAASLIGAWIVISLAASLVVNPELSRIIQITAWTIAALNIVGLLGPTVHLLDQAAVEVGELRISVLSVLVGGITLGVLVWLSVVVSNLLERRLEQVPALTPALQVLFGKLVKITLVALAVIIGLTSAGIDLTAFAVFGGAIGVGIGFGLQKVISNLISGVILLLDRSIKPGDVIEVGQTYGFINTMAARYTSVITRDGTEHLIPNEDIITRPVINWTYSHTKVRRRVPLTVAYKTDLRLAMALMIEAAAEVARVLDNPEPRVRVRRFGDNGVDLELRMWIDDAHHGVTNVASDVMLKIWDKFHDNGIEFPYPQRDVRVLSMADGGLPDQ
ncbi:MAG: mechanosensitive ion channel family protein [Sphingomonadales bacterium]